MDKDVNVAALHGEVRCRRPKQHHFSIRKHLLNQAFNSFGQFIVWFRIFDPDPIHEIGDFCVEALMWVLNASSLWSHPLGLVVQAGLLPMLNSDLNLPVMRIFFDQRLLGLHW